MGRLTGKYSKANPVPSRRIFSDVSMDELEPLLETMRRIADKHHVSVSSVALNYVICKGANEFDEHKLHTYVNLLLLSFRCHSTRWRSRR